ncbi:MAG: hypothetical protein ACYSSI_02655 [Planctomycetota bacterium]|jgi:hypothetical protein
MLEQIKTQFDGVFSEITIDSESRVLHNVALVGMVSRNNRRYTREALQTGATKYEGVRVYIDHPHKEDERRGWRSVRDLAGKIENVRFDGQKLRGDISLLNNDGGKLTFEIANGMPEIAGMSHNAFGKFHRENGQEVIETIDRVVSVDVVTEPATNNGFFESILKKGSDNMEAEKIAESLKRSTFDGTIFEIEDQCIDTNTGRKAVKEDAEQIVNLLKG